MLTQELIGSRNGKTRELLNIAKEANQRKNRVLFLVPTNAIAEFYKSVYQLGDLIHVEVAAYRPIEIHKRLRGGVYDCILMDGTQSFDKSEGDPVNAVEALFMNSEIRPWIISAKNTIKMNLACLFGRHKKVFASDSHCVALWLMTGVFRPWFCTSCGKEFKGFPVPSIPMPKVKEPSSFTCQGVLDLLDAGKEVDIDRGRFMEFAIYLEEIDRPINLKIEICGNRVTLIPDVNRR